MPSCKSKAGGSYKKVSSKDAYAKIMANTDTFIFDCDGVLWLSNEPLPGAFQVLRRLKAQGKNVFFVTNASTKTRDEAHQKIVRMGFDGAEPSQVFSTAYTCALQMKNCISPQGKVYLVGNAAMETELRNVGVKSEGIGPDGSLTSQSHTETMKVPLDPAVEAVLVGFDGHFSLSKMVKAASYLQDPACKFVATNEDRGMLMSDRRHFSIDTGVLISTVAHASGRQPDVICGKPHTFMFECMKAEVAFECGRALMIGDTMKTDISFGKRNGMKTLLVLSGVESVATLKTADKLRPAPDYLLDSLNDWVEY